MRPESEAGRSLRQREGEDNSRLRFFCLLIVIDLIDRAVRCVRIVRMQQYRCILERSPEQISIGSPSFMTGSPVIRTRAKP